MPQNRVVIKDGEVRSALGNALLAVKNLPAKVIRPELDAAVTELKQYPATLPNQRYVRTGRRGAATKLRAVSGNNAYSKSYVVESRPVYGGGRTGDPYTVGNAYGEGQASIHQGRWKLLAFVVADAIDRIIERGYEYMNAALRKGPGGL